MKTALCTLFTTVALAPAALAGPGAPPEGTGLLTMFFLAFAAAILVFQFVPAIALFASMIHGLFAAARRRGAAGDGSGARERA